MKGSSSLVSKLLVLSLFVFLIASDLALAKEKKTHKNHKKNTENVRHVKIQEQEAVVAVEEMHKNLEKRDLSCPNDCSSHGRCDSTTGTCTCDKNFSGVDCSYAVEELTSGVASQGSVTLGRWQYFQLSLQSSANLNIWVNESSRWSDCDVYVQRNAFPSRSVYYASSTSSSSNSHLVINGALFGTWYFGVYGFSFTRCSFSIQVDVSSVCNSNCSGHGTCQSGECVCDAGWTGGDCSTIKTTLENGIASPSINIAKWQWMYFLVNVTTPSTAYLKVTVQTLSGDPDLYIKRGKTPSTFSWDALNVTTYSVSTVIIQTPAVDAYYVGVFGFQASTFVITAEFPVSTPSATSCPSKCSSHGTCNADGTCQCLTGYNGVKCQNGTSPLVVGTTVSGYVAQNDWNTFYFQYTTANPIKIHVEQASTDEDCDVYVKKTSPPTRFSFDAYSISAQSVFDVIIPNPSTFNWYIGVFGWKNCTYSMTLTLPTCDCVEGHSHGSCSGGGTKCICNSGWTGIDCLSSLTDLENGVVSLDAVGLNSWVYYRFTITSSNVAITVKEMGSAGYFWVYVAENPPTASIAPTLDTYTYKETGTGSLHNIFISRPTVERISYVIGIYGNPYNLQGAALPFQVVAYGTNF